MYSHALSHDHNKRQFYWTTGLCFLLNDDRKIFCFVNDSGNLIRLLFRGKALEKQLTLEDRVLMSELRTTKSGSMELRNNERSKENIAEE